MWITLPRLFDLKAFGNIYTRITNPTSSVLEEKIAALEGGTAALAVASGHAAQFLVMHALMNPGDNFIASTKLYGGSINQFNHSYKSFDWNVRWADPADHSRPRNVRSTLARRRSSSNPSPIRAASSATSKLSRKSPRNMAYR